MGRIADSIINDYKREQFFKNRKKRELCKEKECIECSLRSICEDVEEIEDE